MKINKLMLIFSILFSLFGINCYSQEELKNKEKDEVVNRIKNDIQLCNEKWLPEARKLLLNGDAGITKDELDSLIVIISPPFKIKDECLVKSKFMEVDNLSRVDDSSILDTRVWNIKRHYNYVIVPEKNKHTTYSSLGEIYNSDKIEGMIIDVFTKKGKFKYKTGVRIDEGYNDPLPIVKYDNNYGPNPDYVYNYLYFIIYSSKIDKKAESKIDHYNPIKNEVCVIYNNRIYAYECLKNKFLTPDLDIIFANNPCNICDCDIDVYWRINEKAEEKK